MTELEKIESGFATWGFYAFQKAQGSTELYPWYLVNLDAFRAHWGRHWCDGHKYLRFDKKQNGDGTEFHAFYIDSFVGSPKLVIATSGAPAMPDLPFTGTGL